MDGVTELKWRDETSYAEGERGRVPPRVYEVRLHPKLEAPAVTIHRINGCEGWFLSIWQLGIDSHPLTTRADDGVGAVQRRAAIVACNLIHTHVEKWTAFARQLVDLAEVQAER